MELLDTNLLSQLFPSELIAYFELVKCDVHFDKELAQEYLVIEFEERNLVPDGHAASEYESK